MEETTEVDQSVEDNPLSKRRMALLAIPAMLFLSIGFELLRVFTLGPDINFVVFLTPALASLSVVYVAYYTSWNDVIPTFKEYTEKVLKVKRPTWRLILGGIVLGVVAWFLVNVLGTYVPGWFGYEIDKNSSSDSVEVIKNLSDVSKIISLGIMVPILAPIGEELVFRAYCLGSVMNSGYSKLRLVVVAIASSVLFASFHISGLDTYVDFLTFFGTLGFGLASSWLFVRYQNVFLNIIFHVMFNGISSVLLLMGTL